MDKIKAIQVFCDYFATRDYPSLSNEEIGLSLGAFLSDMEYGEKDSYIKTIDDDIDDIMPITDDTKDDILNLLRIKYEIKML